MSIDAHNINQDQPIASLKVSSVRGPAMFALLREMAATAGAPRGLSNQILVISPTFVDAVAKGAPWTIHDSSTGRRLHDSAQNFLRTIDRMVSKGLTLSGRPEILEAFKALHRDLAPTEPRRSIQPL